MSDNLLGPWVRRFLLEHMVSERNLAPTRKGATAIRCACYCHSLLGLPAGDSTY